MAKNYYDILGISREANPDQIKKAYRKLARQYHPDISKEADAEERMQEINVAYDTLSHDDKKIEYDFQLDHPQGTHGFGQQQGQDFGQQSSDFSGFEDLFGRFGSGFGGGNYQYQQHQRQQKRSLKGEDQHASLEVDVDVAYHGSTQTITLQIPSLNAYGQPEVQRKTLQVKIPVGMKAGQSIRLTGQGQAGINGGENGDLYIEIQYKHTATVHVEDADVYFNIPISPWEAALGQSISVKLPSGRTVHVNVPKNSQTGQSLRLKDQGIPSKTAGHLFLILNIEFPKIQNEQQQLAYQSFAEAFKDFNPRQT